MHEGKNLCEATVKLVLFLNGNEPYNAYDFGRCVI